MNGAQRCQCCGQRFANTKSFEAHLKPDFKCMTPKELHESGQTMSGGGWKK